MHHTDAGDDRALEHAEEDRPADPVLDIRSGTDDRDADDGGSLGDRHSLTLLEAVTQARTRLDQTRVQYVAAIKAAAAAGISATKIAHAAGITEGGIRQTLRRNR